jgi:uncharacterized SAM-binding protein YcdF (DUF218 family)
MQEHLRPLVQKLWDYHRLNHTLRPADAIVVLCSHDMRVAEYAARVWLEGWAPLLVFSGGLGSITRGLWQEPEADQFARIALGSGVPAERILIENRSTNTGENVRFTRQLLDARGLAVASVIAVQKPYMERRAYATFRKVWPETDLVVTSPGVTLDEYLSDYSNQSLSADDVIDIIVGDLQRIQVYAEQGFQIPQPIPGDVWDAYQALVRAGYDKRLVSR